MCGVAGVQGELTCPSREILRHRGPDAFGEYRRAQTRLLHWRLSIVDLSEAGNQPLTNETETLWLVFNGEVYNFQSLRSELEAKGHRFRSHTDSEVVIHLYEELGAAMLPRLRGMFAFALFDEARDELFLARDRFGIKPLVYAELPGGFAFASELRALADLPEFSKEIDPQAVELYFRLGYIPAPWTIWTRARKLRPGHYLRVRSGRIVEHERYATLAPTPWSGSVADAAAELEATLLDSVRAHLVADVPVGAFLSGGLDSSLVVAMAQRLTPGRLRTFTISSPDSRHYDDPRYARRVAEALGTDHTEIPVTTALAQRVLEEIVDHLDEPFADASLVPTAIVSEATRAHVKVALAGDGGDELFAGYNKYRGLQLAELLLPVAPLLRGLAHLPLAETRAMRWGNRLRHFRKLSRMLERTPLARVMRSMELLSGDELGELTGDRFTDGLATRRLDELLREAEAAGFSGLNRLLYLDAHLGLPHDMLFKVDTASMAHSLEIRVPLVDIDVARLAFSFPSEWKLTRLRTKWMLRRVAAAYLPAEILRRAKRGFALPIGEWIRNDLRQTFQETLHPERVRKGGMLNPATIERLFAEHLAHKRDRFWELWSLFVFERWRARHLA